MLLCVDDCALECATYIEIQRKLYVIIYNYNYYLRDIETLKFTN